VSAAFFLSRRHAELVSASIERLQTKVLEARWTPKQVQGDEMRQIIVELKN
jgi:hypothetical protein